jgi:Tol biopolymer transport system component
VIFDVRNGVTTRLSLDSAGREGNHDSMRCSISGDGRYVAFESRATNLVANDTNHDWDVFVRDRDPDGNGIFDEATDTTTRVSVRSNRQQADEGSYAPVLSADGLWVAFESDATNLVNGDANGSTDVFVHDMILGTTRRVSVDSAGLEASTDCYGPSLSGKGECVAFHSAAILDANDTNQATDVFVRDLVASVTDRISINSFGTQGDNVSAGAAISGDGQVVAFGSYSSNFDTNGKAAGFQAFVRDRAALTTKLASSNGAGAPGDGIASAVSISADGADVAFVSDSDNLVANDYNAVRDTFLFDRTIPPILALWSNYGNGFAGSFGVPNFVASADPVFDTTIALQVDNSALANTVGIVFVGFGRASLATKLGGTLLVDFTATAPIALTFFPPPIPVYIPPDPALVGVTADLQVVELDPGAVFGWSFTPGLELQLGL